MNEWMNECFNVKLMWAGIWYGFCVVVPGSALTGRAQPLLRICGYLSAIKATLMMHVS